MKAICFIVVVIFIVGCATSTDHSTKQLTHISSQQKELKDSAEINLNLNNPALYGGSKNGFMGYIQALYKTGQFDELLRYTSYTTISKFGRKQLLDFYSKMDFGYTMKLKSQSKINDSVYVMNYECDVMATKVIRRFMVIVEGGESCKLFLSDLRGGIGF